MAAKTPVRRRRRTLSPKVRKLIRAKTEGRCHVCGGPLGRSWDADHVRPHARGGTSNPDNYLPACSVCNRARWKTGPIELRKILAYGIFAKRQMRRNSQLGRLFREGLRKHKKSNKRRRAGSESS